MAYGGGGGRKEYDNTNRITVGKNDKRENDKQPEYRGQTTVLCPHCDKTSEHWISLWIKEGSTGKFFSGLLKWKDAPKDGQRHDDRRGDEKPKSRGRFDDDIPF